MKLHRFLGPCALSVLAAILGLAACSQPMPPAHGVASTAALVVRPGVGGTIDRIGFQEGARVTKGQILFRVDPRPFRAETERRFIARNHALSHVEFARASQARAARLTGVDAPSAKDIAALAAALQAAQSELNEATLALNASKVDLSLTEVRAPTDGHATRAMFAQGEWVSRESLLTTIIPDNLDAADASADTARLER